jgi:SAM-dependent methyltransferase
MVIIPSMDDWFRLRRRHHRDGDKERESTASKAILKHYGTLACIDEIERRFAGDQRPARILEFGHGFSTEVLERFQDRHEMWGADRDWGLPYMKFKPGMDWETHFARRVAPHCPKVTFQRCLLGEPADAVLPDGGFDAIYSTSVLEELAMDAVEIVLSTAYRKLRPGGILFGTHDLYLRGAEERIEQYLAAHRAAGFVINGDVPEFDWHTVLLENPTSVMLYYQGHEPEETRTYHGHYATLYTVAWKL